MAKMLLGYGICGWEGGERRSQRYGSLHLSALRGSDTADLFINREKLEILRSRKIHLTVKILVARKSSHVGDKFLKIAPSQPGVGEVIDLGVGILEIVNGYEGYPDIVLRPGDGRTKLWLDPRKLYRLHDQTVEVWAEETSEDFTPAPNIEVTTEVGAIDVGGDLQVVNADAVRIPRHFERVGDGLFIVGPQKPDANGRIKVEKVR